MKNVCVLNNLYFQYAGVTMNSSPFLFLNTLAFSEIRLYFSQLRKGKSVASA